MDSGNKTKHNLLAQIMTKSRTSLLSMSTYKHYINKMHRKYKQYVRHNLTCNICNI